MHAWATWNGVASTEKRYESPSFDQKKPQQTSAKTSLHNAELFLSSRPSLSSPTELNIQLLKQKAKRKATHQPELNLPSKGSSSSLKLNSHLAKKKEQENRLLSAQITSTMK